MRRAGATQRDIAAGNGANLTKVDGHIAAIKRWRDVYNSVGWCRIVEGLRGGLRLGVKTETNLRRIF